MLAAALWMAWATLVSAQSSPAAKEHSLSISRGSLTEALDQFSKQTGLQVGAELKTAEQQTFPVGPVAGTFTPDAALRMLLQGTGLGFAWEDDNTIRIYEAIVLPRASDGVHEVLVTGSRLGGGEGPAPVRVYDRAELDRYGVSTIPGVAGYFTQQPFSFGEWNQRSGAQHFQMRGLGVDTTLVLINGRRAPPSATSVTLNAFDLNTIPLTAVDRIEVMSDSASAIYGSDAIGGVVNIILKKAIEAPDVYFHYGAAAGGGAETRVAGSLGTSTEKFKSSLVLDYFDRDMLLGEKRDLWRNQDFTRFGGRDYRASTANPGNVYSLTAAPLPGLPTTQASVPAGSSDLEMTPEDFVATAGVVSRDSAEATRSLKPDLRRLSLVGSAEYSARRNLSLFGEVLLAQSDVYTQGNLPFLSRQIVPATNPYNPFGQPVAVDYSFVGMKPVALVTDSSLARLVAGARGRLVDRWDWELALTGSDERVHWARINDLDSNRVRTALASTDPLTALNPFSDGPAGSEALLASLVGRPQEFKQSSRGLQASGFVRGELFRMPHGMTEVVLGGEWRREQLEFLDTSLFLQQARDIAAGFAEIKLPLLDRLSFKLALRGDYYERASDSVNPQYGLVWRPAQDWLLRVAYGTSFRPPSLPELSSQRSEFLLPVVDPYRGGSAIPARVTTGGNPELDNVYARSLTGGMVYEPNRWPGLHLGIHYWRVSMGNRILLPRLTDLAYLEDKYPERVLRYPQTDADRAAGWRGALQSLDVSLLNFGRLETRGIDLDLSYRFDTDWGQLRPAIATTWVDKYVSHDLNPILPADRVGIANVQGTIPRWRAVGSLALDGRGWGVSGTATFTPRYRDTDLFGVMDRHLASRTVVDMQAWLELGQLFESGLFDDLRVTAGALNLFDREADFANAGFLLGYDYSQVDMTQRFVYLRVTKGF